jgi:leader peptidase (prepilin peptidase)/N-methyltransferase
MSLYRTFKKQSFFGNSKCDKCKKGLKVKDLVPIISFLVLKGRCRYCKRPLDKSMVFVELTLGLTFATIFILFYLVQSGLSFYYLNFFSYNSVIALVYYLIVASCVMFIFVYDLKHFEIPYSPVLILFFSWVVFEVTSFFKYKNALTESVNNSIIAEYINKPEYIQTHINSSIFDLKLTVLTALGVLIFFAILFFATKGRGLGFGDVYTAPVFALIAGFPLSVIFVASSFIIGATYGVIALIVKKASLKTQVPFAPFMVAGLLLSLTLGPLIASIYI